MNKVDELVEWVATGIEVSWCKWCGANGRECRECKYLPDFEVLAKQILSYPDLAIMLGREDKPDDNSTLTLVIPLADLLKEKE